MLISVDPGKSGAYAAFTEDGVLLSTYKVKVPAGQRLFGAVELNELWQYIHDYQVETGHLHYAPVTVVMEGILEHRMPNQSPKATNTTALNHGMQQATVILIGAELDIVPPKQWKKAMGLSGKDKQASVDLARSLVDDHLLIKPRMKKHNVDICEAVLLGIYYGRAKLGWGV